MINNYEKKKLAQKWIKHLTFEIKSLLRKWWKASARYSFLFGTDLVSSYHFSRLLLSIVIFFFHSIIYIFYTLLFTFFCKSNIKMTFSKCILFFPVPRSWNDGGRPNPNMNLLHSMKGTSQLSDSHWPANRGSLTQAYVWQLLNRLDFIPCWLPSKHRTKKKIFMFSFG